ncbi:MAG: tRNA 2-thiouridine(34) synthase MnmA [Zunongwangia sp.]|jgi:tRNA-specific 2-thiouridylase|uniref:tRNA 2-thiouridine(34) synthase MnmA n=1 Tax=Zunongwangia profunda TaxID=398743 RepID=UPI000C97665F|nr:tRNA 2-thiouridine(34) synthase MnmA [Zunongwangia profunda]MAO35924.1 tRNA 2-thiouridine(34) synthase MnmA [Zunongwangia sp.]MCC4229415.1 tRNA 2-thiouridine(34) synthase MnmA [Zunongwangia profunda]HAJ82166.1 tRNA 2-thiouridine(34) synthase MnmA [Zunongwangia profunda]|tara:strand:+ start:544 stop:1731 length:1188 start_codon:yes stop_codon:yes gene_type:complete
MKKVVLGLSGGVDSSVSAYLLKEQGYEVIGLFMKNWHDDSVTISDECPWLEDSNDAMIVAEKLGIPFQTVDLSEQYKERIVDYMFNEYERGRTPNPDVLCNREIKFDVFMKIAISLGADYVATGHYCRKGEIEKNGEKIYQLLSGKDNNKDQSYFLCQLTQEQLSKTLFPIGKLQKSEVRRIAAEQELVTADKKDSQGLCFIGKVRLPDFLQQKLKPKEGNIVEINSDSETYKTDIPEFESKIEELKFLSQKYQYQPDDGKVVGKHQGAHYFTKGQRKGLAVGGTPEPLFVIDTDVEDNVIYTGQGKKHPGIYRKALFINEDEVHWVRKDLSLKPDESLELKARIRYRQPLQEATLYQTEQGMYVVFKTPQASITEGQFVAWYDGEELLGSGVIS